MKKKHRKRLEDEIRGLKYLIEKICQHLGIQPVSLTSFDTILKELYPHPKDTPLAGDIHPARVDIDKEARIARAEEIAAKMFASNKEAEGPPGENNEAGTIYLVNGKPLKQFDEKGEIPNPRPKKNLYETIIETIEFPEQKPEAKVRIPPNLELGF